MFTFHRRDRSMWSVDSQDYYGSVPLLIDSVLTNAQPGGIVLLHDGGGDRPIFFDNMIPVLKNAAK